jgi:hypothetical protein
VNLDKATRDWIIAGLALLLIISLFFFPWFDLASGPVCSLVSCTRSATGAPDGWLGILAVLGAIALIADVGIEQFSPQTVIPSVAGGRSATRLILAAITAGFVALKFLFHIHFSYFGWGFYLSVVITAGLVFLALQANAGMMPGRPAGTAPGAPPPPGGTAAPPGGGAAPPPGGGTAPPPGGGTAPPPGGGTAPPPGGAGGSTPPPGGGGGTPGTPPGRGGPPPPGA